jgi:Tol biopolymer transport system component
VSVRVRAAVLPSAVLVALLIALAAPWVSASRASPDANGKIAFQSEGDIWTMNPDGTDQIQLTSWFGYEQEPSWSPDGTKIAFARDVTGGDLFHIFVMNQDGSEQTDLTPDARLMSRDPTWSPDGSRIAYVALHPQGVWNKLIVMNADGSSPRVVPIPDSTPWKPSWSGVSNHIVFEEDSLWVTDVRGNLREITHPPTGGNHTPDWSRDGVSIAFVGSTDTDEWIFVITRPGGMITQLTSGPDRDRDPAWSPDGTRIAFARGFDMWTMANDGSDLVQLTSGPSFDDQPAWQAVP